MKTDNKKIDQLLRSAFAKKKRHTTAVRDDDSPDYLLISKYIDGSATDEERRQIDQLQVSSWRIRRLVQSSDTTLPVSKTVIPLLLHRPAVAFRIAACILVLAGAGILAFRLLHESRYHVTESHIQCTTTRKDDAGFSFKVTRDIYMKTMFTDPEKTQWVERRLTVKSRNGDEAFAHIVATM